MKIFGSILKTKQQQQQKEEGSYIILFRYLWKVTRKAITLLPLSTKIYILYIIDYMVLNEILIKYHLLYIYIYVWKIIALYLIFIGKMVFIWIKVIFIYFMRAEPLKKLTISNEI